jgi:hypothetical protein
MEKTSQGCKRVESLTNEMKTTLSTTICSNEVPTKKKKTSQEAKRMKSLSNFCVKKRLCRKVRNKGWTNLNAAMCNNRKLTKTKKNLSRTKKNKELVQLVKEGASMHRS